MSLSPSGGQPGAIRAGRQGCRRSQRGQAIDEYAAAVGFVAVLAGITLLNAPGQLRPILESAFNFVSTTVNSLAGQAEQVSGSGS